MGCSRSALVYCDSSVTMLAVAAAVLEVVSTDVVTMFMWFSETAAAISASGCGMFSVCAGLL